MVLKHICEVCGKEDTLDSEEAFKLGWDYPPYLGTFRVISARTCPNCSIDETVWWALAIETKPLEDLSQKQIDTLVRIQNEPLSIMPDDGLSN